jgi:serine/threonine protein kinase/WD40 repeat protein
MEPTEAERDPLDVLAEEFVERRRLGESVSISDYVAKHPHLAEGIRKTFATALMLECLKPSGTEVVAAGGVEMVADVWMDKRLGDYRMLREIGRGGMGVVYEAEQISLGRRVALKVLGSHWARNDVLRRRFDIEARAAARLHHSNIVPIFGVGEESGTCYYVMQFIQGQDLDVVLNELRRMVQPGEGEGSSGARHQVTGLLESVGAGELAYRLLSGNVLARDSRTVGTARDAVANEMVPLKAEPIPHGPNFAPSIKSRPAYWLGVASMGLQVAEALQYAHEAGILHRDIKPSNLMFDHHGRVWVTDFGLAKLENQPDVTRDKDIVGTLRYMAPERLRGQCDARSDIYGLGLVLYELLTLRPAYPAVDRHELIQQIARHGAPAPRSLDVWVPRDLETVVLKAMSDRPADRYSSASELADDLRRFLEDRPICARRFGVIERVGRWCRRNPLSAGLIAGVVALMVTLSIGSFIAATRFHHVAEQRSKAMGEADAARKDVESTLAELYPTNALAAARRGNDAEASLWFANAAVLAQPGSEQAKLNGLRAKLWSRSAAGPVAAFDAAMGRVREMSFCPGGRFFMARPGRGEILSGNGTIGLWDLTSEKMLALPEGMSALTAAAWSANGRRLAVASAQGSVVIFELPALRQIGSVPSVSAVELLEFSRDGNLLAFAGGGTLRLWDCAANAPLGADLLHQARIVSLSFSSVEDRLLIGTADGRALVRRLSRDAAEVAFPAVAHQFENAAVVGGAVAPLLVDVDRIFLTVDSSMLVWRRAEGGQVTRTIPLEAHPSWIVHDGSANRIAVGAGEHAMVFEQRTGKVLASMPLRRQVPCAAAMSPDGMLLLIAERGKAAQLWSLADGARLKAELECLNDTEAVVFSAEGDRIAASEPGGLIRVLRLPIGALPEFRIPLAGRFAAARFDASGRYVMASGVCLQPGELRTTQVYDVQTGAPAGELIAPSGLLRAADFSPGGQRVVTVSTGEGGGGVLQFWDWRVGGRVGAAVILPSEPVAVRYDARGGRVAARCAGGQVMLIDSKDGAVFRSWLSAPLDGATLWMVRGGGLAWSPDGRNVVTWGSADVQVWDPEEGKLRYPPLKHNSTCSDVHFSGRGEFMASAGWDRAVRVWDVASGRPVGAPLAQDVGSSVRYPSSYSAQFLPDDRHLLVSGADGRVAVWDWRSNQLLNPLSSESDVAASSGDGRWALTGSDDRGIRLWDVANQAQSAPVILTSGVPLAIEVAPGGRYAAVTGSGSSVDVLRLDELGAPAESDPRGALAWSELVAGQRLERGHLVRLSAAEWGERWRALRAKGMAVSPSTVAEWAVWHRQQAGFASDALNLAAEYFHLQKLVEGGVAHWSEWARCGEIHAREREWRKAAELFAGAMRLNPDDPILHLRSGDCLIAAGDWNAAAAAYTRAMQLQGERHWIRGNWWSVGPYPGGLDDVLPPENQSDVSEAVVDGGGGKVSVEQFWKLRSETGDVLEFHDEFNWAEYVAGYGQVFIYSSADEPVTFSLGSDDSLRLWLNGERVFEHNGFLAPGSATAAVRLKKGWNRVLAKVVNERRHHSLFLKILDNPPVK